MAPQIMKTTIQTIGEVLQARNDLADAKIGKSDEGEFIAAKFHLRPDLLSEWVIIHPFASDGEEQLLRVCCSYPFEIPGKVDGYRFCQELTTSLALGAFLFHPERKLPIEYIHQQLTASSLSNARVIDQLIDEALRAEVLLGCALGRLAKLSIAAQFVAAASKQTNPALN